MVKKAKWKNSKISLPETSEIKNQGEALQIAVTRTNKPDDGDDIKNNVRAKPVSLALKTPNPQEDITAKKPIEEAQDITPENLPVAVEQEIMTTDWGNFDVKILAEKILLLGETISKMILRPYQKKFGLRVIMSVLLNDGEEITALFARQSGKTETIAIVINALMIILPVLAKYFPEQLGHFAGGLHVGLFAPQSDQAMTTFERMKLRMDTDYTEEVLRDPGVNTKKNFIGGKINLDSGSYCRLQSAAKQTKIESKTYHIVIIEEAQDMDTMKVQKSIHPMVAATNGTIVKIGTSTMHFCEFLEAIGRNKQRDIRAKLKNHFEFDYKVVQKYAPKYKAYIQKEIGRLTKESDAFRMAYMLEWILERAFAMTIDQFETFMKDTTIAFNYGDCNEGEFFVGGLDLARKHDYTILTILKVTPGSEPREDGMHKVTKKSIANWLEMKGDNWESQIERILEFIEPYNLACLKADSTGVGDPIVEFIKNRLFYESVYIDGVVISQKWTNNIVQLFYSEMRQHRIRVPYNPVVRKSRRYKNFINQWMSCEKIFKGKIVSLKAPEKEGFFDDYIYSLLLAVDGAEEISKTGRSVKVYKENMFFGKSGNTPLTKSKRLNRIARLNPNIAKLYNNPRSKRF